MAKYLVIIESPGKIKKISSFLGKDYKVLASVGHIRDLPKKKIGIDIKKDFEPTYEVYSDKKDIVKKIKDEAKKAEIVYLATDLDREGEGIAKHIADVLPANTVCRRATYGAITKSAVVDAINNAGEINHCMVNSYECRRMLDRLVGWKCSFITQQATGGKSAGRVQSASLRILAEREKEIQSFVPKEYWPIEAVLEKKNGERITASIKKPNKLKIKNQTEAEKICEALKTNNISVSKYEVKEVSTKAYAPFTTSTMYQSASSILNWSSDKTALIAQKLYEDGLVTYIRSDSTFIIPEFIDTLRGEIPVKYGESYLPHTKNAFFNKKNSQEAHEAIRVTDIGCVMATVDDKTKLYNIIWKRTMSSQMANMRQMRGSVEFSCKSYLLSASGSKVVFDGFRKVWDYGNLEDTVLPEFEIGEDVKLIDIKTEQKFTTPPPRYTDQTIIKEMEKRGIGRPSTYANTIKTLLSREYVEKQKKSIHVTDMGIRVSDFLINSNFCFIDINFSADLEEKLDCIAEGDCDKVVILGEFWDRLKNDIEAANLIKKQNSMTEHDCPKCDGKLLLKHSKYGPFLSCENYSNKDKKCDYKCDADKNGNPVVKEPKELDESEILCSSCGEPLIIRSSKKNAEKKYLGCRNFNKDQDCRGFFNLEGEKIDFTKKKFKKKYKKKYKKK